MSYVQVTLDELKGLVVREEYHRFPDSTMTVCCLYLNNGFTVTGEAACLNMEDYDPAIGQRIAYDDALEKLWQLQGYARVVYGDSTRGKAS